jgi:hypothetical protein
MACSVADPGHSALCVHLLLRAAHATASQGLSADDAGPGSSCSSSSAASSGTRGAGPAKAGRHPTLQYDVFFPLPPFAGLQFNALKAGAQGYNFTVGGRAQAYRQRQSCSDRIQLWPSTTLPRDCSACSVLRCTPVLHALPPLQGQLLGVGGKQLQRIKEESRARVEVVNATGNLNGAHPDPLDTSLHAHITADGLAKLQKAVHMVWELLSPVNASFEPIHVVPGGSARLTVSQASRAAAAAAAAGGGSAGAPASVAPGKASKGKAQAKPTVRHARQPTKLAMP